MTTKRPRKHLDRKDKYVGLPHWFLTCAAWKALPLAAKVLYVEGLELRYNGCNNGDIRLSEREAAEVIGSTGRGQCTQRYAAQMLDALEAHGFIRPQVKGRFHVKIRYATRWTLTRYEHRGQKATMDFARWKPGAEFKQRRSWEHQSDVPRASDGPEITLSDVPGASDSARSAPPTEVPGASVLVHQGERSGPPCGKAPRGNQQRKAEWLREHLAAGTITTESIAAKLGIGPDKVDAIAAGKVELAKPTWQRLAELVAERMN